MSRIPFLFREVAACFAAFGTRPLRALCNPTGPLEQEMHLTQPPSIQPRSILPSALRGACVGHLLPLCRLRGLCCLRLLRFDFYWPTIQRLLYFKEASITAKDCLRQIRDLQQCIVRADPEHFSFDDGGMSLFSSLIKATAVTPRKEAFHCEAPNER